MKIIEIEISKEVDLETLAYEASVEWSTFVGINRMVDEELNKTNVYKFLFKDGSTVSDSAVQSIVDNHNPLTVISENYEENRLKEYPPITDQLDMQYWDQINGTTIWKDTITAIKEKYPKG